MANLHDLKRLMVRICHMLAQKDYVSAMDGNVSVRLDGSRILCTPTMIHKAFVTEEDLLIVDEHGQKLEGPEGRQPTSEIFMHLAAYQKRQNIHAIVHAHPPTAIAFTIASESLARCVLPEVVLTLGAIPTAPYRTAGSMNLAKVVGDMIAEYDALLLDRHGVISVGTDLIDAFGKMEKVEHTAMITLRARSLGRVKELDAAEVDHLRELGRKYSSTGALPPVCEGCGGCATHTPWQAMPSFGVGRIRSEGGESAHPPATKAIQSVADQTDFLRRVVTEEVVRAFGSS